MSANNMFVNCLNTVNIIFDFISNKKPGMYLRFGDGDFNLAENKSELLASANPEIAELMLRAMSIRDERVLICIPHHCKQIDTLEDGMYPGNHEYTIDYIVRFINILKSRTQTLPKLIYTNVALSYCSVHFPDTIINIHKEIKKYNVIYIGNYLYSDIFLQKLFGDNVTRINTNSNNAFNQKTLVFNELTRLMAERFNKYDYYIIVIAAGCASRAFSSLIYDTYFVNNPNFFLFDYGSLLDYLYGLNTRAYMDLMPPKKDYILNNI
jgi:hypothetical protein